MKDEDTENGGRNYETRNIEDDNLRKHGKETGEGEEGQGGQENHITADNNQLHLYSLQYFHLLPIALLVILHLPFQSYPFSPLWSTMQIAIRRVV